MATQNLPQPAPNTQAQPITRRRFLQAGPLALAAASVAPLAIGQALVGDPAPEVGEWFKGEYLADTAAAHPPTAAAALRWELSKLFIYPLACYPPHPTAERKRPAAEAGKRHALAEMIEGMAGPDLAALFNIAALMTVYPLTSERRERLAQLQAARFVPGGEL